MIYYGEDDDVWCRYGDGASMVVGLGREIGVRTRLVVHDFPIILTFWSWKSAHQSLHRTSMHLPYIVANILAPEFRCVLWMGTRVVFGRWLLFS
jgi:hypothetical protein